MNNDELLGVVGAGVMGIGVTQKLIENGFNVLLVDINEAILKRAVKTIKKNLQVAKMFGKKEINIEKYLNKIETTIDIKKLSRVGLIVENIKESITQKESLYSNLSKIIDDNCLVLANTSCIPITKLASILEKPERVIGVHFMNPVPLQNFAEVISGYYTSEETIFAVSNWLSNMNIECTVINDSAGFVSNRLSHLFINEAANLVMEGVATPHQIDEICIKGFHHEMGPLQTADLIGLDTVADSLNVLFDIYKNPKYSCSPLLQKLVDSGNLGQKSGQGFYNY